MALTDAQKAQIRRYLGYPDVNRLLHHQLEGALVAISAAGETEISGLLAQLATLDAQLQASWGRQKVKKAENVVLAGPDEICALRHEGRRLVGALATLLDVSVRASPFDSGSSVGIAGRG